MSFLPPQREFKLTEKQCEVRRVFTTAARYLLVYGGSRSGKTFFICYAIATRAIKAPGSRHAIFRRHAVSVKQSIGKDTFKKVMELAYPEYKYKWKEQDGYFEFENGSEIWLAGLDDKERVDKVLGREFVTLYFNEASEIAYDSYAVALSRLAQVVYDVSGKKMQARCYVDLNPTTNAHWTYKLWILNTDPETGGKVDAEDYAHIVVNPVDNAENLDEAYLKSLANFAPARRARFYDGKYMADDENALWQREMIRRPVGELPDMVRIVVALDPATSSEPGSDEHGLIAAGLGVDGNAYVLEDGTCRGKPTKWATEAVALYHQYEADRIVAEINQGGEMVEQTIRAINADIPYKGVRATRGKVVRAEPIAELYQRRKVYHVHEFPQLEDQMCSFTSNYDRKAAGLSPDRVDALVWALTELFPGLTKKKKKVAVSSGAGQVVSPMAGRR